MDKGAALNKRVWSLFELAGFTTVPNSHSAAEHKVQLAPGKLRKVDLFAREGELGVTIVASNKSGGIKDSRTAHVNDWKTIGAIELNKRVTIEFRKAGWTARRTYVLV